MKTYHYFWQLIRFRPGYYAADVVTISIHFAVSTALGLILRAFFNYLTGATGFSLSLGPVVGLQLAYAVVFALSLAGAALAWINFQYHSFALLIRNMFDRVLAMPGARPLPKGKDGAPLSTGQAISTFRDDTEELLGAMVVIDDVTGLIITAGISFTIMLQISPLVTLGTFLPLTVIVFVAQRLGYLVKKYRQVSREATSQVTGIIADMFNATQAIKVGNAEERIIRHFEKLNEQRREAMVKDRVLTQLVDALSHGTVDVGMGLVLLLAAGAMNRGEFTIGDFALFAAYIWPTTQLMRIASRVITRYKQAGVSIQRMETMMQGAPIGAVVAHHPIYMDGNYPEIPFVPKTIEDRLELLEVSGLTYRYPSTGDRRPATGDDGPTNGDGRPVSSDISTKPALSDSEVPSADPVIGNDGQETTVAGPALSLPKGQRSTVAGHSSGIININLRLQRGSFTVVTGRIGAGKTTLLKVLLGLLPVQAGEIRWNGELVEYPADFFVPPRCAYTGQVPRLF
ncbi:MAG TPA: ABC transporter ATP-binding protein, partial [Anaerolineae bacterium]